MPRSEAILLQVGEYSPIARKFQDFPGIIFSTETLSPEERPRLCIAEGDAQGTGPRIADWLKSRIPVAFSPLDEFPFRYFEALSKIAVRNQVPFVVLGGYRWLPAIATAKEILSTECLGNIRQGVLSFPDETEWSPFWAQDIARWLQPGGAIATQPANRQTLTLRLEGENGALSLTSSLDGHQANATLTLQSVSRRRYIPQGNPRLIELGVLKHTIPPQGKIKFLPLLTSCF